MICNLLQTKGSNDMDTRKQVTDEVMYKCSSIFVASQVYTDGIILPQDTRKVTKLSHTHTHTHTSTHLHRHTYAHAQTLRERERERGRD